MCAVGGGRRPPEQWPFDGEATAGKLSPSPPPPWRHNHHQQRSHCDDTSGTTRNTPPRKISTIISSISTLRIITVPSLVVISSNGANNIFFFCNRYDCIPKHWLIVYCNCFILKWWHFLIVCKYLWILGISCCLCWGLHEFVTKQSELPVRSSRCPSTALLLSKIRLLSNITDTSLKFHGVPSNIVQYNPTLPNTIQFNKHFTRIPLNTGRHYSVKGRSTSCSQQINSSVQSFNLATNDFNIMQLA